MKKDFCIVSICGRLNEFYKTIPKETFLFDSIVINSHQDFNTFEFLEKIENYSKIIFVLASGSRSSFIILNNILRFIKNDFTIITTTPFKFEGKKRNQISNEFIEYLNEEKLDNIVISGNYILEKYYVQEKKQTLKNAFDYFNLEIRKRILRLIVF